MNLKARIKLMLLGEDSLFSYFLNREIEHLTLGIMGMFYLPMMVLIQAYLCIDIYFRVQEGTDYMRPVVMSIVLIILALIYGFYVYRAKRKKAKIIKVEKAVEDLPQIFLNSLIEGLRAEKAKYKKDKNS